MEFMRLAHKWNSDHVVQYSANADASRPEDSGLITIKEQSSRDRPVNKFSAFYLRSLQRTEPVDTAEFISSPFFWHVRKKDAVMSKA